MITGKEIKARYEIAAKQAQADAEDAGEGKIIYLWYSAFLEDFVKTAGLAGRKVPTSKGVMRFIREFMAGVEVKKIRANTIQSLYDFGVGLDMTETEEHKYIDFYLNSLAMTFPANYGDILTCKPFWNKVIEITQKRLE